MFSPTETAESNESPNGSINFVGASQEARDNASFGRVPCPLYPYSEDVGEDVDSDSDINTRGAAENLSQVRPRTMNEPSRPITTSK